MTATAPTGTTGTNRTASDARTVVTGVRVGDVVIITTGGRHLWGVVAVVRPFFVTVRIGGTPHVVPAIVLSHVIDPEQQPDLPIDTILDDITVRVARIDWPNRDALTRAAKGKPAMRKILPA